MHVDGLTRAQRSFFARPVLELAPLVLDAVLVRATPDGTVAVRLTEVEAYAGLADPGSHSYRGRTARNATMWGPPGHLYCYFTYGMHHALNIVCDDPGVPTGCLLRAGEVVIGTEVARRRREAKPRKTHVHDAALARGPGNLATVFAATRADDGADLLGHEWSLWLPSRPAGADRISTGPRVGVSGPGGDAFAHPWRFWLTGERTVSTYRSATARRRRS
ncbi:MAG: DNA-3-methyladenine glycosylase [Actinomycetes bacterium]|nr:DNA-3-methyladenine glycosylase [Actinomycetes bacterium]MDX5380150.1 DNA-3-methyladenine glycosylase [Actinomycetes bacterium]MDX5398782.1 DNA-3-methyladenine glycosylase [Actinomycetes bacterium]MDX5449868.1 DNA-3-methyladenine glycosylase [Actinomycetes bacterium]